MLNLLEAIMPIHITANNTVTDSFKKLTEGPSYLSSNHDTACLLPTSNQNCKKTGQHLIYILHIFILHVQYTDKFTFNISNINYTYIFVFVHIRYIYIN